MKKHLGVAREALADDATSVDQYVSGLNLISGFPGSVVGAHRNSLREYAVVVTVCQRNTPGREGLAGLPGTTATA